MPYTFDPIFAADPNNPAMVAKDAAITIFDPAVPGVPVTITDPTGAPLPNPITVNASGFGPAFQHATLDRVGWAGGGFSNFLTSYEGMKSVATEAKAAAEAAQGSAATAGANAASAASAALSGAVADAEAAQAAAEAAAALVNAPADAAIEAAILGSGTKTKTALNATIASVVGGEVAAAVAADETVTAAAAMAVDDVVAGLDVVTYTDPAIPTATTMDVNYEDAIALDVDAQGYVSRAVLPNGTTYFPRLRVGTVEGFATATERIKGRNILCRGDSITAGALGGGVSYPAELSRLVPGVPVFKRGWPGEKTKAIAQRQGSVPMMVTVTGGVLPATTAAIPVTVDASIYIGADAVQGVAEGLGLPGSINGVSGRLTGNISSGFNFTRNAPGGAYNCPDPLPWVDEWESTHRDANQIIWTGRNNVNVGFDDVVPYTQTMVDYQIAGDYLVLSVMTRSDEPSGSAGYNRVVGWNNALSAAHGANYYDIRGYLIANGLTAAGITPTAEDTSAIANNTVPPSLLADGLHPNAACYKVIAAAVKTKITEMGWV